MPIHHAIWKVGSSPESLSPAKLASEKELEDMIVLRPEILSPDWMLIGQQIRTSFGGIIDLLAITPDGSLVLIELKRNKTPREIVAQALDYASWVEGLKADAIAQIYERFRPDGNLDKDFLKRFDAELDEETLNESHQIIIVASELDDSTERIINYLNARDLAINAIFFQVFSSGADKLLSRAWLIDPGETQVNAVTTSKVKGPKIPWNGEYYASFGDMTSRSWEDARTYGFISAGGGAWYSRTLKLLSPGARVWVKIPKTGYVGVCVVEEPVQRVDEFKVMKGGVERSAMDVLRHGESYKKTAEDPDKAEYFVRVKWLETRDRDKAVDEVGLFGNQNSVCQPTTPKWEHTVERLKEVFTGWDKSRA
jgi:hypothetical protein